MHFLHFPWANQKTMRREVFHTWKALLTNADTMNLMVLTLDQLSSSEGLIPLQQRHCSVLIHINTSAWQLSSGPGSVHPKSMTKHGLGCKKLGVDGVQRGGTGWIAQRPQFQGTVGLLRRPSQISTQEFELLEQKDGFTLPCSHHSAIVVPWIQHDISPPTWKIIGLDPSPYVLPAACSERL